MAKRETKFHITKQGGTIKSVRVLTPETELEKALRKKGSLPRRNPRGTTPFGQLPKELQGAYRNRMISRLMQLLHTIKNPIKVFFSLAVDNRGRRKPGATRFKKYIAKFFRKLLDEYPQCWFVYKIEWTHKAGFHLHLIGALSYPGLHADSWAWKESKTVKILWDEACDQAGSKFWTMEMTFAGEAQRGYLAKSSKREDDIRCMKKLNGRSIFGKVNGDNIKYYLPEKSVIDEEDAYDLILALIKHDKDRVDTSH